MEKSEFKPQVSESSKPPEVSKSERLSDEEMGNLISAIGNHEAKAVTLAVMKPQVVYGFSDISMAVSAAQDGVGWRSKGGPFNYCKDSLEPIGLVAKEVVSSNLQTLGYMKTEKGMERGDSLAGLLLDFSIRYPNFSLQDIFGITSSPTDKDESVEGIDFRKRAPITRIKIYWEILTRDLPAREVDIANALGEEPSFIRNHLIALASKGVIIFDRTGKRDSIVKYHFNNDKEQINIQPEAYRSEVSLTQYVYDFLKQNADRQFYSEEIAKNYLESKGEAYSSKQLLTLRHNTSHVLAHLLKGGYLRQGRFSEDNRSDVNLTDSQKDMLFDLVERLDRFKIQDSETIAFGKRRLNEILASPDIVAGLMVKAREHSPQANGSSREEWAGRIINILLKGDSKISDLENRLGEEGKKASRRTVEQAIERLVKEGKIRATKDRGVNTYSLIDSIN